MKTCWICSKGVYSLFFAKINKKTHNKDDIYLQFLPEQVRQSNHCVAGMTKSLQFKMEPVVDFCMRVDSPYMVNFNFLEAMRDSSAMKEFNMAYEDMDVD